MFQVGLLQDRVEGDRFVALEQVAQVAELKTRIGLDQQDVNLLLAHLDRARLPVVLRLKLARLRLGFHDELELADLGGAEGNADRLRLPSGPTVTSTLANTAGLSFSRSTTGTFRPS